MSVESGLSGYDNIADIGLNAKISKQGTIEAPHCQVRLTMSLSIKASLASIRGVRLGLGADFELINKLERRTGIRKLTRITITLLI